MPLEHTKGGLTRLTRLLLISYSSLLKTKLKETLTVSTVLHSFE